MLPNQCAPSTWLEEASICANDAIRVSKKYAPSTLPNQCAPLTQLEEASIYANNTIGVSKKYAPLTLPNQCAPLTRLEASLICANDAIGGAINNRKCNQSTLCASTVAWHNAYRICFKEDYDQQHLGEFLPTSIESIFGPPLSAPDDNAFVPPQELFTTIQRVSNTPPVVPVAPLFRFDTSNVSVQNNTALFQQYDYQLHHLLANHQHTTLAHGSEFSSLDKLLTIFGNHNLFKFFADIHNNGMEYKVSEKLTED